MITFEFQEKGLEVIFPVKTNMDLDALNYIASGMTPCFFRVKYLEKDNKHSLFYYVDSQSSLSETIQELDFNLFCTLIKDYSLAAAEATEHGMLPENIKADIRYIFYRNGNFQFIYLPILGEKVSSIRKSLLKILGCIKKQEPRIADFEKNIKKIKRDKDIWEYGNTFLMIHQEEEETTLLSGQGETTMLSSTGSDYVVDFPRDHPAGASQATEILENEFSESETTLLSSQHEAMNISIELGEQAENDSRDVLYIVENKTGEKITVDKNVFMIGKDAQNMDYVISDNSVSRHHATITCEEGVYYIMDNKSTNGTTIEGVALQPFEKAELYQGSIILLGNVGFQIKIERR